MPKTILKYDIDGLSSDVNSKIKECNKYLNIASQIHSSIKIPDDFNGIYPLKNVGNNIRTALNNNSYLSKTIEQIISDLLIQETTNTNNISVENVKFNYNSDITNIEMICKSTNRNNCVEYANQLAQRLSSYGIIADITLKNDLSTDYIKSNNITLRPGSNINTNKKIIYNGISFITTAQKVWINGVCKKGENLTYSSDSKKLVPISGPKIDCSSFVSWVLAEYGYPEFYGVNQYNTSELYYRCDGSNSSRYNSDNINLSQKYNWTVYSLKDENGDGEINGTDAAKIVKDGDIVVFIGHTFIVKEVTSDGDIITYDCGDESHWTTDGTEDGTHSTYFSPNTKWYNKKCKIISIDNNITFKQAEELESIKQKEFEITVSHEQGDILNKENISKVSILKTKETKKENE